MKRVDLNRAEIHWGLAEHWLKVWAARYDYGFREGALTQEYAIIYQVAVTSALFWSGMIDDGETLRDHLLPEGVANFR